MWIIFTFLAIMSFAIINVLDKFVYEKLTTKLIVPLMISGIVGVLVSIGIFLLNGYSVISIPIMILTLFSGVVLAIGIFFYNNSVKTEEISRLSALFSLEPLVLLIFATLFLGEHFSTSKYVGIFLLVFGAFIISIKNSFLPRIEKSLIYVAGSIIFFALFSIIVKYVLNYADFWTVFAYSRIGMFLTLIPIYFLKGKEIKYNLVKFGKKSIFLMMASSIITVIGYLFWTIALNEGYVSLVSALASFQPLMVLILSTMLTVFFPNIVKENISKFALILKLIGVSAMITGSIFIM